MGFMQPQQQGRWAGKMIDRYRSAFSKQSENVFLSKVFLIPAALCRKNQLDFNTDAT